MRILFVTSKSLGGSGKYVAVLGKGIKERYPEIKADVLFYPSGVSQDQELVDSFEASHSFSKEPGLNPLTVIKLILEARALVKSGRYELVHAHTSIGGLIGRLATVGTKAKSMQTLHAFGADEFTPQPMKSVYWVIEKLIDWATTHYIAPSEHMKRYGCRLRLFKAEKVTVVHNSLPLQPPVETVVKHQRLAMRQLWGTADDSTVLLFCGRLEPQKGFDILLAAFKKALQVNNKLMLVVCGVGELEDQYRALALDLGVLDHIRWEGWVSDVSSYYAASDVYVMPSRWESFGLVFLEAMNYRKPVLSTTTQAIPEVVADGETGLLCENGDVDTLAQNIVKMSSDEALQKTMGDAGFNRLYSQFGFDKFVDSTTAVYFKLMGRGKSS